MSGEDIDTLGECHVKTGGDSSDAAASQGMARINRCHQKLGRGKDGFPTPAIQGNMALLTPAFY